MSALLRFLGSAFGWLWKNRRETATVIEEAIELVEPKESHPLPAKNVMQIQKQIEQGARPPPLPKSKP